MWVTSEFENGRLKRIIHEEKTQSGLRISQISFIKYLFSKLRYALINEITRRSLAIHAKSNQQQFLLKQTN